MVSELVNKLGQIRKENVRTVWPNEQHSKHGGCISGLKTAAEIVRAMKGLENLADVQTKVIELQSAILDAQSRRRFV